MVCGGGRNIAQLAASVVACLLACLVGRLREVGGGAFNQKIHGPFSVSDGTRSCRGTTIRSVDASTALTGRKGSGLCTPADAEARDSNLLLACSLHGMAE